MPEIPVFFLQGTRGPPGDPGLTVSNPCYSSSWGNHGFSMHSLGTKQGIRSCCCLAEVARGFPWEPGKEERGLLGWEGKGEPFP